MRAVGLALGTTRDWAWVRDWAGGSGAELGA